MAKRTIRRIGVLTGGGDCPGLNAVIRAVVRASSRKYRSDVIGIHDGFKGLVEGNCRVLADGDVSGILDRGGTILGSSNRDNPFDFAYIDSSGKMRKRDASGDCIETINREGIDALIVIGGDGTLSLALKFNEMGIPVVGVPKTIDNDLSCTDVTFGFDSALAVATDAIDRLHTTAESHHRVMVLELMGRYAGWIALKAGIAGGGDVILIPEIPFTIDSVIHSIEERRRRGKCFSIIAVAEGAKEKGGKMVVKRKIKGSTDPLRLGGIANRISREIEERSGIESRAIVLGHLQRGGSPTPFDRILGTRFGVAAVEEVMKGKFGRMVALDAPRIVTVPIKKAVGTLKKVDPKGDDVLTARAIGTAFGDETFRRRRG